MKRQILTYVIATIAVAIITGIVAGLLLSKNSELQTQLSDMRAKPIPTVMVTMTITPSPKIIHKTITNTVYRNGYSHIGDDPLWNCAGNWYNAYIRLANNSNMPAGDSGLWNYYCPGIPQPGN